MISITTRILTGRQNLHPRSEIKPKEAIADQANAPHRLCLPERGGGMQWSTENLAEWGLVKIILGYWNSGAWNVQLEPGWAGYLCLAVKRWSSRYIRIRTRSGDVFVRSWIEWETVLMQLRELVVAFQWRVRESFLCYCTEDDLYYRTTRRPRQEPSPRVGASANCFSGRITFSSAFK